MVDVFQRFGRQSIAENPNFSGSRQEMEEEPRLHHPICKPCFFCWRSARCGSVKILCFSQKLYLGTSASVAKSLFHWLRGRFMMLKRMLRIQFL